MAHLEPQIVICYGEDAIQMVEESLTAFDAARLVRPGQKIVIKPNLVNSTHPDQGATTHPAVVEGVIRYFRAQGFGDIKIIESSWVGGNTEEAFRVCGYDKLCARYDVPFVNALKDDFETRKYQGIAMDVAKSALGEAVFLVDVPVLKAHCQTDVTCCLKNLKGLIPAKDKRNFHALGLHKPIAALGKLVPVGLNVVDAICGDLTFEEGGNPVKTNMVLVSADPLLADSYAAELIGYHPAEIPYLALAKEYGVGEFFSEHTAVCYLGADKKPKGIATASSAARNLGTLVDEREACSACYSALIRALHQADRKTRSRYQQNKIAIGQGFRGKKGAGLGCGNCTAGFSSYIKGCPPKAVDILKRL